MSCLLLKQIENRPCMFDKGGEPRKLAGELFFFFNKLINCFFFLRCSSHFSLQKGLLFVLVSYSWL